MTRPGEYQRMIAARDATQKRIGDLDRRLSQAARSMVESPAAHRGDSAWRKTDEAEWQAALATLRYNSRNEIGALSAKLERQQTAIRAWISRPSNQPPTRT